MCQALGMTRYDPAHLDELGARRARLRAELKDVNDQIAAEVPKALRAGIIQAEVARRTGMTRESIAQLARPKPERWKRGEASHPTT
jgi:transcriptional regulator with XRE-family HTH domain